MKFTVILTETQVEEHFISQNASPVLNFFELQFIEFHSIQIHTHKWQLMPFDGISRIILRLVSYF